MNADQKRELVSARTKMLSTGIALVLPAALIWTVEGLIVGFERSDELGNYIQTIFLLGVACAAAAGLSLIADLWKRFSDQRSSA